MSNTRTVIVAVLLMLAAFAAGAIAAHPDVESGPDIAHMSAPTQRPDLATWQTRPCKTEDSVNCRYISTNPGGHTFSVRLLPGRQRMVCVFYADRRYAASHDYCVTAR